MSATLFALVPLVLAPQGGSTMVSFADDTFDDEDWETTVIVANGTGEGTAVQVLEGNPAPARRVTHDFVSGAGLFSMWVDHRMTTAVYDPVLQGPIERVYYALDSDNQTSSHRLNWALWQGGKLFVEGGPSTTFGWSTHESEGLVAADFVERLSSGSTVSTSQPDFSASGAPISFGFETHNGSAANTVRTVDYDNFRVHVNAVASSSVVRQGSPPNPDAFRPGSTSGPVIGTTWDPFVDHASFQPGATMDFAVYSRFPGSVPTNFGMLLCAQLEDGRVVPAGQPFAFAVPDDLLLVGQGYCFQAASLDPLQGLLLTNALDVTIGTL